MALAKRGLDERAAGRTAPPALACVSSLLKRNKPTRDRVHALDAAFGDHDHFAGLHASLAVARDNIRLDHNGLPGAKRILRHRTRRAAFATEDRRKISATIT